MKHLLPALLILAGAAAAWLWATRSGPTYVPAKAEPTAFAPAPPALTATPGPGERVEVLDVEGMCCKGCTGKLYARLMETQGVRCAAVDLEGKTASVVVTQGTGSDALARALTFEEYSAQARERSSPADSR